MPETVTFYPIEALAVAALTAALPNTTPVSTKVPNPRPASFVRVQRVGGKRDRMISDAANLVVECWASDDVVAESLAETARAAIFALVAEDVPIPGLGVTVFVRGVEEIGGIQDYPDPVSGAPRFVFTVQISTRGVATP